MAEAKKKPDFKAELKEAMGMPAEVTKEQKDQAAADFKAELPEGKLQTIALKLLRESDLNLRKVFNGIEELAANMKGLGRVLSPLLVRAIPGGDLFEIIAGARRFRAAKKAGFEEVPCNVVKLSDAQVAEVMLTENLQREDLHPLEEAEGYDRLLTSHHYSVAQIAAKIGKSKGHVHARVKLLALGPEARKAFRDGRIDPTVAVPLARISSHKHQAEALNTICPKGAEKMSSRAALEFLQTRFAQTLKGAPFNQNDETLVTKQVVDGVQFGGSCLKCPHRSGSTPGLFEDIAGHDTCTHTPCFALKKDAAWAKASAAAESRGAEVQTVAAGKQAFSHNNELHAMSALVLANAPADGDPKKRTWKQLVAKLAEDKQPAILFVPDRQLKGRECFNREEVLKALAKDQKWAAKEIKTSAKLEPQHEEHWAKERTQRDVRDRILALVVEKSSTGVDELALPQLRIVAIGMQRDGRFDLALKRRQLDEATAEKWVAEKATAKDLAGFIFEMALTSYLGSTWQGYTEELLAMAKHVKVDVKAQEKVFTAELAAIAKADAEKKAADDLMKKPADVAAAPAAAEDF